MSSGCGMEDGSVSTTEHSEGTPSAITMRAALDGWTERFQRAPVAVSRTSWEDGNMEGGAGGWGEGEVGEGE